MCLKLLCAKAFCAQRLLCARDFFLTMQAFWRAEELRWVEKSFDEMRKVEQCSDEMKIFEENLLRWHMRWDEVRWEELRWGEKSSDEMRWDEVWSAKCKCQVWSVKCEECSAKCARHARTGLAGACKFYS